MIFLHSNSAHCAKKTFVYVLFFSFEHNQNFFGGGKKKSRNEHLFLQKNITIVFYFSKILPIYDKICLSEK